MLASDFYSLLTKLYWIIMGNCDFFIKYLCSHQGKLKDALTSNEHSTINTIDDSAASSKEAKQDHEHCWKTPRESQENNWERKEISDGTLEAVQEEEMHGNIYQNEKLASANFGEGSVLQLIGLKDLERKEMQPKCMAELVGRLKTSNDSVINLIQSYSNSTQTLNSSKPPVCPLGVDWYGKILHVGPNAKEVFDQSDLKNQNIFDLMASYNKTFFTRKFGKYPILGFKKPVTVIRFSLNHEDDDLNISVITCKIVLVNWLIDGKSRVKGAKIYARKTSPENSSKFRHKVISSTIQAGAMAVQHLARLALFKEELERFDQCPNMCFGNKIS